MQLIQNFNMKNKLKPNLLDMHLIESMSEGKIKGGGQVMA